MDGSNCSSLSYAYGGLPPAYNDIPYWYFMSFVGADLIDEGVYAILFGFSFSTSLLCLYYLFKNWKPTRSHHLNTAFTLLLTLYNIFTVVARIMTLLWNVCKGPLDSQVLQVGSSVSTSQQVFGLVYVPIFFWISDAFLLYRAWDVWVHRRSVIIPPGVVYLASIMTGVVCTINVATSNFVLDIGSALQGYTPAIGFSLGLDVLITGMIAGRLIYHDRRVSASAGGSGSVLPIAVIFIESAALSTLSKVIQITLDAPTFNWVNPHLVPFVIPLCTLSSNFIILRKALGADVTRIVDHQRNCVPTIQFEAPGHRLTETLGRIPGGFESHLRTMLGASVDGLSGDLNHGR